MFIWTGYGLQISRTLAHYHLQMGKFPFQPSYVRSPHAGCTLCLLRGVMAAGFIIVTVNSPAAFGA